jgi:enoyl-CoA hydratase/carnithine racemase
VTEYQLINYEQDTAGIAQITLNRPNQLNALNQAMSEELHSALDLVDTDPSVRILILTGTGRAFCAGADLASGPEAFSPRSYDDSAPTAKRDWGGVLALRLFSLNKPIIAAINGASVGVGATMTLPCDIRIASTGAKFGFVFARRGIVTDACSSWFLPRIVGISTALRWCLSGDLVSVEDAHAAGLIDRVYEPGDLLDAARTMALEITSSTSAVSVTLIRHLLWQGLVASHPMQAHQLESDLIAFTSASDDAREGVTSFMEKRPALFSGSVPRDLPTPWPPWVEPEFASD